MNSSFIALFLLGHLISLHFPFLPRLPSDVNSKGIVKALDPGDKLLHAYPCHRPYSDTSPPLPVKRLDLNSPKVGD
jgi:hypothetical protein